MAQEGTSDTANWEKLIGPEKRVYDAAKKLWPTPTSIQQAAIPHALQGKDILAKARTGSGKTASYIIPILIGLLRSPLPLNFKALILVPTRELCKQVKNQFDELGRYCKISTAHLGDDLTAQTQKVSLMSNPPAVLIGTPARVYALKSLDIFSNVRFLVVDEADQQLGLDSGPDIEAIISLLPPTRQSFLMSATLDEGVENLTKTVLNNPIFIDVTEKTESSQLSHYYIHVTEENRYMVLYTLIQCQRLGKRILLFVNSINRGYKLRLFFERFGIRSSVLNSQLPVASRINILDAFNIGTIDVLIAIDEGDDAIAAEFSASRGVDFQNLQAVVNFDLPQKYEQYVHRVGRTARGNRQGIALTFANVNDDLSFISDNLAADGQTLQQFDFDTKEAEIFNYRVSSVLESITKKQIKDAQKVFLKREILNSEKLKTHFEENPHDLQTLRHDSQLLPQKVDKSLKDLPSYLGAQVKRMSHPLTQKIKDNSKSKKKLGNIDSLNAAIQKRKKKEMQKKKFDQRKDHSQHKKH